VIAALPNAHREGIDERFRELKHEVESLGELRRVTGKAQAEIASTLRIKQPSVSKLQRQTDMYLSTLKSYVEAIEGPLDLIVSLPSRSPLHIEHLGNLGRAKTGTRRGATTATARRSRAKGTRTG
jgi:hypothetical protein